MKASSAFNPQSALGHPIFSLFILVLIIMAAILILVTGLVVYASIRYRRRSGQADPPSNFGNPKLEVTWTALPLLLLVAIFILTAITMSRSDPSTAGNRTSPDLVITGHQWWWEVHYPGAGVVTANEVHLPAGKRVLAEMESADVIHDFWVPQLGRKMDMIPGSPNWLWMEADSPGTYLGSCSEYCGEEHAWMRIRVIAQSGQEFQAWEQQQSLPAPTPQAGAAKVGAQLFLQRSCANCHSIAGTAATQRIGPDLTHVAGRQTLAAGRLENTPENLSDWLRNPDKFKPGSHMPNLQLQPDELHALTAYLETLQ